MLAALAAFWQVAILIWDKVIPKVEVRIQNLPHGGHYTAGEEETFIFEMENKPRKSIFCGIKRKLTLHNVSVQMYFPARFTIVQVNRHAVVNPMIGNGLFEAPVTGGSRNQPYNYVFVPDPFNRVPPAISSLAPEETEWCYVTAKLPNVPGTYKLLFDISHQEGDQQHSEMDIQVVKKLSLSNHNQANPDQEIC